MTLTDEALVANSSAGHMSRNAVPQPGAFERANYMKFLSSYAMRSALFSTRFNQA